MLWQRAPRSTSAVGRSAGAPAPLATASGPSGPRRPPAACSGLVQGTAQLNAVPLLGTGVMLWANVPITLFFSRFAMREQHAYLRRMAARPRQGPPTASEP